MSQTVGDSGVVVLPLGYRLAPGEIWDVRVDLRNDWWVTNASVVVWGVAAKEWSGDPCMPVAEVWGGLRNEPASSRGPGMSHFHGEVYVADFPERGNGLYVCAIRGEEKAAAASTLSLRGDAPGARYVAGSPESNGVDVMLRACRERVALLESVRSGSSGSGNG